MQDLILQHQEKEHLFAAIVNSSSDAIIFLDPDGIIAHWNLGAEDIFGYSAEEAIGQPYEILVPAELKGVDEMNYVRQEMQDKGNLKKYETRRQCNDGSILFVDISSTQIRDEKKQLRGRAEIIKEIQSRKELEFELLQTILELAKINELNDILHNCYDEADILRLILVAMTAGEGLRFNRAFLLLVDRDTNELRGELAVGSSDGDEANRVWTGLETEYRYLQDIVKHYTIDKEGADREVNDLVRRFRLKLDSSEHVLNRAMQRRQVALVNKDYMNTHPEINFSIGDSDLLSLLDNDNFVVVPLFTKAEPLGVLIADNIITRAPILIERLHTLRLFATQASAAIENARLYSHLAKQNLKLREAYNDLETNQQKLLQSERLAAIGEMSAKIAHEIRNPLVAIGGFAGLIEKAEHTSEKTPQYAGIIRDQVTRLEHILNNLLSASRPVEPHLESIDIRIPITEAMQVVEERCRDKQIELSSIIPDEFAEIRADRRMIQQMLLNLLINSVDACKDVEPAHVSLRLKREVDWLVLEVRDNGCGIEPANQSRIFEAFYTTKSGGTGLGLSIVNQIMRAHGGRLDLHSETGVGTNISLRFPS
ncbi:MAG: PAS domain-containing sensor histidine kinase [Calditrichia bacterium]